MGGERREWKQTRSAFPLECSSVLQRDGEMRVAKILNTCLVASPDTLKKKIMRTLSAGKFALCA